jgi:adenine-specific DNA-methyltransferase
VVSGHYRKGATRPCAQPDTLPRVCTVTRRVREACAVTVTESPGGGAGSPAGPAGVAWVVASTARFPRLRYMGSKYRLVPELASVFRELGGRTALDAFCGSGVVSYTMKCLGYEVTANDFLTFPAVVAKATVENQRVRLTDADIEDICGPPADDRNFIQATFDGLYFTAADRAFLDSAWSHIDRLSGHKRAIAVSALVLAAARKQPRGVFTITDLRYDDGRRDLRLPLREQFVAGAAAYNAVVFDSGRPCRSVSCDIFDINPAGFDLVYLDPPYAPPTDDNCYIKRYHFLEGLSGYWRGMEIMAATKTKKLAKRHTPFSYKHSVTGALRRLFGRFRNSRIVLSYSSNAVPDVGTIEALLREVKDDVEVRTLNHRYSFGTHAGARRREASEYLFIAR